MPMHDRTAALAACTELLEALDVARSQRDRRRLERAVQKDMAKAFRAQGRAFLKAFSKFKARFPEETTEARRLTEAIEDIDWGPIFDRAAASTLKLFTGPLDKAMRRAIASGFRAVVGTVDAAIAFDLKNPRAVAFLKGRAAEKVAGINDTTKERLRKLITKGVSEGWSYSRLANAITARFETFAEGRPQQHVDSRAHLIAITEMGEAYCEGQMEAGHELAAVGIGMEKLWSDIGDDKVSDGCKENAAAGWIPLENEFPSGHQRPLRFPGCRCDLLMRAQGAED